MYAILVSAIMTMLGFVVRSILVKFVVFFALWFITTEFINVMQSAGIFPNANVLNMALGNLSPGLWYFLNLFAFHIGIPMLISASVTRFIIRRIPVIG